MLSYFRQLTLIMCQAELENDIEIRNASRTLLKICSTCRSKKEFINKIEIFIKELYFVDNITLIAICIILNLNINI